MNAPVNAPESAEALLEQVQRQREVARYDASRLANAIDGAQQLRRLLVALIREQPSQSLRVSRRAFDATEVAARIVCRTDLQTDDLLLTVRSSTDEKIA